MPIERGERFSIEGVLKVDIDPRNPNAWRLTVDGLDLADAAAECWGNAARTGVRVRVTIERIPNL